VNAMSADRVATTAPAISFEERRVEGVTAVSRLVLCAVGVAMVRGGVVATPGAAYAVLLVYLVVSIAVALALLFEARGPAVVALLVHLADVLFAMTLASLDGEGTELFQLFLIFPLLSASYRWGLPEALATAVVMAVLLAIGPAFVSSAVGDATLPAFRVFTRGALVGRGTLLLVLALVLAVPLDAEQQRRREARCVSDMLLEARSEHRLSQTLQRVLTRAVKYFGGAGAALVLCDRRTGRIFVRWATSKNDPEVGPGSDDGELPRERENDLLFEMRGAAAFGVRSRFGRPRLTLVEFDALGVGVGSETLFLSEAFRQMFTSFERVIIVRSELERRWMVRLFVFDPRLPSGRATLARAALRMTSQVGPVLYDHYLVRRLRSRAITAERARIARELHDGPIQSLLAVDMELAVLRRRTAESPLASDLGRFHEIVKSEVISLRELLENVRAGTSDTEPLEHALSELVRRFGIYTGTVAQFVSNGSAAGIGAQERRELVQIVVEALANVRKHSAAKRVTVRTKVASGRLRLTIEDSGRGFPFAGVRTAAELRKSGEGPRTILERVQHLSGDLRVKSTPGTGCIVEVSLPMKVSRIVEKVSGD
jgi:signal transduction histidine kinase